MKRSYAILLTIAVMSSFSFAQYKGKYVGWSTGYVYGRGTLSTTLGSAFTHLVNFHITVTTSGGLDTGDLPQSDQPNFVSMAHALGCKALLCIGGEGEHDHFVAATATAALQTTLIKNIMKMVISNGYDGVDLDWEVAEDDPQNGPYWDDNPTNVAHFFAFHKQIRDSVRAHPPLIFTAAITDDWYPNCSAAICTLVVQANSMSYDQSDTSEWADAENVFRLGAPKSNHGIGFNMTSSYISDNCGKCRLAIDSGFGGVMGWSITGGSTAMFDSLARYVNKNATPVVFNPVFAQTGNESSFFVKNDGTTGLTRVSYSIPTSVNGSLVDIGMFDVRGRLVGTVFHGVSNTGIFDIATMANPAGTYILRLSTNNNFHASRALVVR